MTLRGVGLCVTKTGKLKISLNSHHSDDMQTVDKQNIKQITRENSGKIS